MQLLEELEMLVQQHDEERKYAEQAPQEDQLQLAHQAELEIFGAPEPQLGTTPGMPAPDSPRHELWTIGAG